MSLGYYFGAYYNPTVPAQKRQKLFTQIGLVSIVLFLVVRLINQYGNPNAWEKFDSLAQTMYSFFTFPVMELT